MKTRKLFDLVLIGFLAAAGSASLNAADTGESVLVVYNSAMPESKEVAEHYAKRRQVPAAQVVGFELSEGESMTRSEFRFKLQEPLFKHLTDKQLFTTKADTVGGRLVYRVAESKIRYLVLCYGVPVRISPESGLREPGTEGLQAELRRNEAAVDSELCWLPILETRPVLAGPMANDFLGQTNAAAFNPTNGILMTARLDGPTPEIARGLVDKAMFAETNGLWGRMYFDLRGITAGEYKLGEDWLRNAAAVARQLGFETVVDELPATFSAIFPMSHIAFYAGWYDGKVSGPFALDAVDFVPGAIAYHLHSFSAANIRTATQNWVGPLLAKGATASVGYVYEPYLGGTMDVGVFTSRLIYFGFSFGEAAYAAAPVLSWQTTAVGDPLYRPFQLNAQQLHERLQAQSNPLIEWSYLRVVNLNEVINTPDAELLKFLEDTPATKESAVLLEKESGLYEKLGKPNSSIAALRQALNKATSKPQRARLSLMLVDKLLGQGDKEGAWALMETVATEFPEYQEKLAMYKQMLEVAESLNKKTEATLLKEKIKAVENSDAAGKPAAP